MQRHDSGMKTKAFLPPPFSFQFSIKTEEVVWSSIASEIHLLDCLARKAEDEITVADLKQYSVVKITLTDDSLFRRLIPGIRVGHSPILWFTACSLDDMMI